MAPDSKWEKNVENTSQKSLLQVVVTFGINARTSNTVPLSNAQYEISVYDLPFTIVLLGQTMYFVGDLNRENMFLDYHLYINQWLQKEVKLAPETASYWRLV